MKLTLRVQNVEMVTPAMRVHSTFSQRGGLIGSNSNADWHIQDIDGLIDETAARVVLDNKHFTLEPLGSAKIYVNGARAPIAHGRPIILSNKDRLKIGLLDCLVEAGERGATDGQDVGSMASFAMKNSKEGDALFIDGDYKEATTASLQQSKSTVMDPLDAIDGTTKSIQVLDPLEALNMNKSDAIVASAEDAKIVTDTIHDDTNSPYAAMALRRARKDRFGFEDLDHDAARADGEAFADPAAIDLNHPVDHVALRPLSRALGVPLGDMSSEQAARMLAEMGGTLRAAVDGVNKVYKARESASSRFPLTTLHMHAVEDNPLRFADDPDEALHAMFTKRGAVHLSPEAAMTEAMDHFALHQTATERAIDKALDTVLAALSPRALERRFRSYAPSETPSGEADRDAWCWEMYQAYFSELKSQRQRGLQMLFWEVFRHEYQSILREDELFSHEDAGAR